MVPPKLLAYLREKKKAGYPNEMLRAQFTNKGWPDAILDEALSILDSESEIQNGGDASFIQATTLTPPSASLIPPPTSAQTPSSAATPPKAASQPLEPARRPGLLRRLFISTRLRIYLILALLAVGIIYFLGRVPKDGGPEPDSLEQVKQSAQQSALDTSYDMAVEQTGFTAHKVTTVPEGYSYATGYEVEHDEETNKVYIRTALVTPTDDQGTTSPIVIRQSAVPEDYDMETFDFGEGAEVTPVVLTLAKSGTAHLSIRQLGESTLRSLIFVSPTNTLVEIVGLRATDDQILQIAQGLI